MKIRDHSRFGQRRGIVPAYVVHLIAADGEESWNFHGARFSDRQWKLKIERGALHRSSSPAGDALRLQCSLTTRTNRPTARRGDAGVCVMTVCWFLRYYGKIAEHPKDFNPGVLVQASKRWRSPKAGRGKWKSKR